MKKWMSVFAMFAFLGIAVSLFAGEEGKTATWTGWLSDSACAAKGTAAAHKDCALKCVKEKGASWVFVNTKDKAVLKINNQDAVKEANLGAEVKVTGHVQEDGSLHIDSIAPAEAMKM